MYVGITGRHMVVTQALKDYAKQKVRKLERFSKKITEGLVTLSVEKYRHKVEILMRINGSLVQATEETEKMYSSIDKAVEKIERQIRKYKEKQSTHKTHQEYKKSERFFNEDKDQNKEDIEFLDVTPPILLLEAAIEKLRLGQPGFFFFIEKKSEEFKVLVRKEGGGIALLNPHL